MITDQDARALVLEGYKRLMGVYPSRSVAQAVQGIGKLETQYGQGWKGAGKGSNNWGAIQYGKKPAPDGHSFLYTDTHPKSDGSSVAYQVYFKSYDTPLDGCIDLIRTVYFWVSKGGQLRRDKWVLVPAERGDLLGVSRGLYYTGYYEGFGKDPPARIYNHYKRLYQLVQQIASGCHEPVASGGLTEPPAPSLTPVRNWPPKTLRRGSRGALVRDWQREVGEVADGKFGPHTETATKAWQASHGLVPDGVVGPKTWAAAEADIHGWPQK